MQTCEVRLRSVDDVKDFVRVVNRFPYDVDMVSGHYVVDAKSIMGIFSLELDKPITLEIRQDDPSDLLAELAPYRVD